MALGSENRISRAVVKVSPFIAMVAVLVLAQDTVRDSVRRWLIFEESYSQGLLLFAVSIFLFVQKYRAIRPVEGFYPRWLAAFVLGLGVYVLGGLMVVQAFQQVILLPLLWCALVLFWGWRQAKHFVVPIGILIFAINIWEIIRLPLQIMAVKVNGVALGLLNIHFYVDDVFVHLPGIGSFEVARGCSGLNYFLVGLTIAVLYGELERMRWKNRIILFLTGGALSLLANWVRVFVIIYVGYESKMQSPLVTHHNTFGWIVFAVALLPLFWLGRRLQRGESGPNAIDTAPRPQGPRSGKHALWGLVAAVLLILGAGYLISPPADANADARFSYDFSPLNPTEWVPVYSTRLVGWQPQAVNADAGTIGTYARVGAAGSGKPADLRLLVSLHSYDYQRDGSEVIQWGNRLYDHKKFGVADRYRLNLANGLHLSALTLVSRDNHKKVYVAYGYYEAGHWEGDQVRAKFAQFQGVLRNRRDASWLVYGLTCSKCDPKAELAQIGEQLTTRVKKHLDQRYR